MTRAPSASIVLAAHSHVSSRARCTLAGEQSATRSRLSCPVISRHPSCSSPTIDDAGTRTSSKKVWLVVVPLSVGTGVKLKPSAVVGTRKMVRPLCFGASGSVRAASHT